MFRSALLLVLFSLAGCSSPPATSRPAAEAVPVIDERQLAEVWQQYQGRRVRVRVEGGGVAPLHPSGYIYSGLFFTGHFPDERAHEFRGASAGALIEGLVDGRVPAGEHTHSVILRDCRRVYETQR